MILEIIQSFIITWIEMICCVLFFDIFYMSKETRKWEKIKCSFLLCMIIVLWSYISVKSILIKEIIVIFIISIVMTIYYKGESIKNIVLASIFIGLLLVVDYIFLVFYSRIMCISKILDTLSKDWEYLVPVLSKCFLLLIINCVNWILKKRKKFHFFEIQWESFFFFPIFTILLVTIMITNAGYIRKKYTNNIILISVFCLLMVNIAVFYLINSMAEKSETLREEILLKMQAENQLNLCKQIIEDTSRQREIVHEYKNQLICMQLLCQNKEYNELLSYICQLSGKVQCSTNLINTNNIVVNAILNAKYEQALQEKILVVLQINDLSNIYLDSQDIVILMANVLDNAIEAVRKVKQNKYIKIKIVNENSNFIISVKNPYVEKIIYKDEAILTTKKNDAKNHGIGLKNIKQIVEKYEGILSIDVEDTEFYISIVIPQNEPQNAHLCLKTPE